MKGSALNIVFTKRAIVIVVVVCVLYVHTCVTICMYVQVHVHLCTPMEIVYFETLYYSLRSQTSPTGLATGK